MSAEGIEASTARRRRGAGAALRLSLFGLVPVGAVVAVAYGYVTGGRYIATENAYVKADKIVVTAEVSGRVAEVAVRENEEVVENGLLFRLDDEPYRIALARAEARLAAARQEVAAQRALYRQKAAELKIADEDQDYMSAAFRRATDLSQKGIVSQAKFDEARRDLGTAQQRVVALRHDLERVLASLGGGLDTPLDRQPAVLAAIAERDQAALDLKHTRVFAPAPAIVTKMNLQVGEHVETGKPVFSLVETGDVWIEANLKETELTYIRVGQPATVVVDAYPDNQWQAVVTGISAATGAEFALLPPQNSSGNWVKVVQRLPVRLKLNDPMQGPSLRAGMSALVTIDTGRERALPSLVAAALAWVRER